MLKIRAVIGVLIGVGLVQPSNLLGEDEHAKVSGVLLAREREVRTFEADVIVEPGPGRDLAAYGQARREYAKWLELHDQRDAAAAIELDLEQQSRYFLETVTYHEHFTTEGGRLRVDDRPAESGMRLVAVWAAGSWSSLGEDSSRPPQMNIQNYTVLPYLSSANLEIAWGGGAFIDQNLLESGVSESSFLAGALPWRSLVEVTQPVTDCPQDVSGPASQGRVFCLGTRLFSNSLWPNLNKPLVLYTVILDREFERAPVYLQCSRIVPHRSGDHQYLATAVAEWSVPDFSDDGAMVFKKCRLGYYSHVPVPKQYDESLDDVRFASYEVSNQMVTFDSIHVNQPVDAAIFTLRPPAGTNVVDTIAAEQYIVGPAGEALKRTAIQARGIPQSAQASQTWRKVAVGCNVFVVLALLALLVYRRSVRSAA